MSVHDQVTELTEPLRDILGATVAALTQVVLPQLHIDGWMEASWQSPQRPKELHYVTFFLAELLTGVQLHNGFFRTWFLLRDTS